MRDGAARAAGGPWGVGHSSTGGSCPGLRSLAHVSVRTARHDASAKYDDERLMFVNPRESREAGTQHAACIVRSCNM